MQDRDEALDFIYKGWREGRQQRRNVVRQRGLDRTRSMLAPIMAQRARAGSFASMPPSMPQIEEMSVPTEQTPVENIAESISSPPAMTLPVDEQVAPMPLENDMTNDITNPVDHPDDFKEQPVEAVAPVEEKPAQNDMFDFPPPQPVEKPKLSPERIEELKAKEAQPRPTSSPPEEQTPVKEEEKPPEHESAFEPAYTEMVEEATTPKEATVKKPVETTTPKKKRKPAKAVVEQTKKTPKPKPAKAVVEATKPKTSNDDLMDSTEGEDSKVPYVKVGNKYATQAMAAKLVRAGTHKWAGKARDGRPQITEVKSSKPKSKKPEPKKPKPKAKPKPKPKAKAKPPKATEKGKNNVRAASDRLAEAGMSGQKTDKPDKDKKKVKGEGETQDLTGTTKPDPKEFRRSADEQMLADVLLKKLPVADLRMFGRATGIEDIAPLLDDKGFMTQVVGVDPSHTKMMAMSDNPDIDMLTKPAFGFDLNKLKFKNSYPGFPQYKKPKIEDLITPPMKTVNALDDEGHTIVADTVKRQEWDDFQQKHVWRDVPIYETEQVEDEGIGWFIADGNSKRRMTRAEAKEILSQSSMASPFQGAGKLDFATPYFDTEKHVWRLPIIQGKGKPNELPRSPWKNFSFFDTKPLDPSVAPYPSLFPELELKEIASFTPKELKQRFKGLNPKENRLTRLGESMYDTQSLKDMVAGMTPSHMADEDIRFAGKTNHPLLTEGRGVVRYDEDPSYWKHFLAPIVEANENAWESMNDLFE